ncbi:STAM-binding protein [Coccidioides immitis RMSCC 2394]|uniref:STAM-binding protein n=1 Tax=Coccidioides immitis RMSCC 2394 TaxID=404692 RepID=A0A0J6YGL4_COCIT|nr:STAM-binding protein [Coccidioides immitis RMSCC 2394]
MIPPLNVAEIARQAAAYEYSPSTKLQYWLRTAASLVKEADVYEREGNDQQAYLLLFRHAQLVLVNLIMHPQAQDPSCRRGLAEAQREVQNSLKRLEVLKPRINQRYKQYQEARDIEFRKTITAQLDDHADLLRDRESHDPAIAGRPQPLAAAENKDLAVKLAQKELKRRAAAKLGHYLSENLHPHKQRKLLAPVQGQSTQEQHGVSDQDDLASRLQEVRARVEGDQTHRTSIQESQPASSEVQTILRRPEPNRSATGYKYPAVPAQSIFTITETVPPLPSKGLLQPLPLRPPAIPAKIPEPPSRPISATPPSAPPVPSKVAPNTTSITPPEPPRQPDYITPSSSDLQPSTFTFKPSSYLENGNPLRTIFISPDLRQRFLEIAYPNTRRNLETCGILCGSLISNAFFISKLLIPEQESTPDTCEMVNEGAVFEYCDAEDLMVLGWIHTHPTQTCFMSSRDLHTQSGYQVMLAESIAIVCAPSRTPDWGVFRLTDPPGLKTVLACTKQGLFHPHEETDIYTDALRPGHVFEAKGLEFETVDLRNKR